MPDRAGDEVDAAIQHLVIERLALETHLGDEAVDLVLAACDGEDALASALAGTAAARTVESVQPELELQPPRVYLASIDVQGFRGVGPRSRLTLAPGPGLTVVVGRNGSGKSSFAEGLELLLTGANSRWLGRTKVWTGGWQNLHAQGDTLLESEL